MSDKDLAVAVIRQALRDAADYDFEAEGLSPKAQQRARMRREEAVAALLWLKDDESNAQVFLDLVGLDRVALLDRLEELGIKALADEVRSLVV